MKRYDQLKKVIEERIQKIKKIEEGKNENDAFSITYSSLKSEEKEKMLKGLKEIIDNPKSVAKNQSVIPMKLIVVDPQMRNIQILINEILNCDIDRERER